MIAIIINSKWVTRSQQSLFDSAEVLFFGYHLLFISFRFNVLMLMLMPFLDDFAQISISRSWII